MRLIGQGVHELWSYLQTNKELLYIYIDGDIDQEERPVPEKRPTKKGKRPTKEGKRPTKKGKRPTKCDRIKRSKSCCGDRGTVGKTCRKVKI